MTTDQSTELRANRNIVWVALTLFSAATAGACANPSESLLPTAPSGLIAVSPTFRPGGPAFGTLGQGASDSVHAAR